MYERTLFLVDRDATVGGLAAALMDLASLGAHNVDVQRLLVPALELPLQRIAEMGRAAGASLIAVGVADSVSLRELGVSGRAAVPDHPLLYLGVNAPSGPLLPTRGRILGHVLASGDYSVRSACVAACLSRLARSGARVVTLMHMPDSVLAAHCERTAAGELGRVDMDWVDQLKRMLFAAGVEEVRFLAPAPGVSEETDFNPAVSLVLAGSTCNADIAAAYASAASRQISHQAAAPALMLTAESCAIAAGRLGAA